MVSCEINMDKKSQRPLITLDNSLVALVDTGSSVPVWIGENITFLTDKLKATLINDSAELSGFGGAELSRAYRIPSLTVSDITFKNVPIVVSTKLRGVPININIECIYVFRYDLSI